MPYADLHVHTTRSDGELELEAVPAAAREAGVSVVGLTDHDRAQPLEAPVVTRDGVTLVHGVELRVDAGDMRVDLLGYGLEPTPDLEDCLATIQTDRRQRAERIAALVEDHTGVDLELTVHDGVGRPHIARAIEAHPDVELDYQDAFDTLIGSDGPCYVPRSIPSFERGLELLRESTRVVSLAHPLRYEDTERALELARTVGGIEVHYEYTRPVETAPVERVATEHDLHVTGGSDAHEEQLGIAGLSESEWDDLWFQ